MRLLVVAAAGFATWLAWIAFGVLCEEGCTGRPWPLVAPGYRSIGADLDAEVNGQRDREVVQCS